MKARRKSDGKIIDVIEHQSWNKEVIYVCNGTFYRTSELDFNTEVEDTVIQGWVCRDKKDNCLNLHAEEPYRTYSHYNTDDKPDWWESDCVSFLPLDPKLFPDLTWESEPEPVEIIIKRKNSKQE